MSIYLLSQYFSCDLWVTRLDAKSLGQRIRQARERKGLSQEDLAHAISRDQSAVSDYEIGKRKLAAFELPTFADALDVPITYFFGQDGDDGDIAEAILSYVHQLETTEEQQAIVEMVRLFTITLRHQRSRFS